MINFHGSRKLLVSGLLLVIIPSIVFIISGCSHPLASDSFVQKLEQPSDMIQEEAGLIGELHNNLGSLSNVDQYIPLVKKYSEKYHIDWILILSMMKQESRFHHNAVSYQGAYGLMQIMPLTQIEIGDKLGMKETITPRSNINAGVYYFSHLFNDFHGTTEDDHLKIALAAYNTGIGRIVDAQAIARYIGSDPHSWKTISNTLALLTKSSYTLHRNVWSDGKPPSGYFRDWKQTVNYVDDIKKRYESYSLALR